MTAIKCFPLAGLQDYRVEDFQNYLAARASGIYNAGGNLEVIAKSPAAMAVRVKTGVAWLKFGSLVGVSFPVRFEQELAIEASDPFLARIDTVVCGLDIAAREGYLEIIKGAWGGGATAPVRDGSYFEIVLAQVAVAAGATTITSGNITDKRSDNSVCGWIREGLAVITDMTTVDPTGVLSATQIRAGEGTLDARPATPATFALYFATDIEQLFLYSPSKGWIAI
ncbi:hypothetical protein CCP3SC1AL1_110037 [Gammaproteobacteria bacterium]